VPEGRPCITPAAIADTVKRPPALRVEGVRAGSPLAHQLGGESGTPLGSFVTIRSAT
jgi:hypothetical protein